MSECHCEDGCKAVVCGDNGCRCTTCNGLAPSVLQSGLAKQVIEPSYDPAKDYDLLGKIALAIRVGQTSHLASACGCMGPSEFAIGAGQSKWCHCAESRDRKAAAHVIDILKALNKL